MAEAAEILTFVLVAAMMVVIWILGNHLRYHK